MLQRSVGGGCVSGAFRRPQTFLTRIFLRIVPTVFVYCGFASKQRVVQALSWWTIFGVLHFSNSRGRGEVSVRAAHFRVR